MEWVSLGSITVGPQDLTVIVGSFSLQENDDTVWVEVTRTNPDSPWPWSYGILAWESSFGRELGSAKAYTAKNGEIFRLGVGRKPRSRTGSIVYQPRSFNLSWVREGYPLTLDFRAASGNTSSSADVTGATSVAFPVQGGSWVYQRDTGLVQLRL